jgi:hypothetical protein
METLDEIVEKSATLMADDRRLNERVEKELPQMPKLKSEIDAPKRLLPKILTEEPILQLARMLRLDPIDMKSHSEALLLQRTAPKTLVRLPMLAKLRTLNALPKLQKLSALTALPNLPPPRTLKLEPICTKENTLIALLLREKLRIEKVEPNCAKLRIDTAEPMRARPITVR